jgi:hypothetical protein
MADAFEIGHEGEIKSLVPALLPRPEVRIGIPSNFDGYGIDGIFSPGTRKSSAAEGRGLLPRLRNDENTDFLDNL